MERSQGRLLVVDDEPALLKTFRYCLEDAGYQVMTAQSVEQAERLAQGQVFDLCFLDLQLGRHSALDLMPTLQAEAPWMRIVVVTASSSIDIAVQAMRAGAVDYLVKPCSPEQLRLVAEQQMKTRRLQLRLEEVERTAGGDSVQMESQAPAMTKLIEQARQVANAEANVLILGESGTGKGVIARAIHGWSPRAQAPFVTVNTSGLSGELFESGLFGHRKGAFTGAVQNSPGRVSQADGGSLFLDEVGDVPLALQPKLLRFIQDKAYERVGDAVTRQADVRFIAATNRDLAAMIEEGSFREDLLYRLDVVRLQLPPLRERRADILLLAQGFLTGFALSGRHIAQGFSDDACEALLAYAWPGNIRELRNVVERASILCPEQMIGPQHLALGESTSTRLRVPTTPAMGAQISLQALERAHILAVIAQAETLEAAAGTLGIDISTLYRKRKQYDI